MEKPPNKGRPFFRRSRAAQRKGNGMMSSRLYLGSAGMKLE